MTLRIETEPAPLESGADGVIRIRDSRVTLVTIVAAFSVGATAEEILLQYPSLQLAGIYAVIAYFLHRRADVEAYLAQRQIERRQVRGQNEVRFSPSGIRVRLLARRIAG